MSLARPVSASQAKDYYYDKDPFFAAEGKGENSEWHGALAAEMNLSGRIRSQDFEAIIAGIDPETGKTLVKSTTVKKESKNGESVSIDEHRAGVDLAFSAPKSVSVAALHMGGSDGEKIVEAHKAAVKTTLDFVEKNCIQYRVKVRKETLTIKADNMICATFNHATSRANDPQLHTHAVICNMVKCSDGKVRAISNELLLQKQKLINNIYQNELARNIQLAGISIDNYSNKFELQGISKETVERFSKRQREIDECYELIKDQSQYKGLSKDELRDIAVLQSRGKKNPEIRGEQLKELWQREVRKESLSLVKEGKRKLDGIDFIETALKELSETEATFSKDLLMNKILAQSRGHFKLEEAEQLFNNAVKENRIMGLGKHISDKSKKRTFNQERDYHYSTSELIRTERDIANYIVKGKDALEGLMKKEEFENKLPDTMKKGQKKFVAQVVTSRNFINIVQGDAGTGKTFSVKMINELLKEKEGAPQIFGLGFTGKAAQELKSAAGIETSTIASFLGSSNAVKNSIIIVDESSMVSSKDMKELIEKVKEGGNRIVMIGDRKQIQAIGAGKMFAEAQDENLIEYTEMDEVVRQKEHTAVFNLVNQIKSYQTKSNANGMEEAFKTLTEKNMLEEIRPKSESENAKEKSKDLIQKKAIEEYFKSDNCILLSSSRKVKSELNKSIRELKLTDEELSRQKKITIKETLSTSFYAADYEKGDIIERDGKKWRVSDIDSKNNKVHLEYKYKNSKDVLREVLNPLFGDIKNVSREKSIEVAQGEKIIFTKNDKKLGVQNGLSGVIEKLDNAGNIFISVKGKEKPVIINTADYNSIDYGYALTLCKSQGQTCNKAVLVHNLEDNMSTENFYVAATRVREEFKVLTPDKDRLFRSVLDAQDKTSTREFTSKMNRDELNRLLEPNKQEHTITKTTSQTIS